MPLRRDGVLAGAGPPLLGIVGCGRMGAALTRVFVSAGFQVGLTSRRPAAAADLADQMSNARAGSLEWVAAEADIIVPATPVEVTCHEIAPRICTRISDKPVMDVSNPGFPGVGLAAGDEVFAGSAAERIANALPLSHVVKGLNCVAAGRLADLGRLGVTVPIAGDDAGAKLAIGSILQAVGFEVADAGPLRSSRLIENLTPLLLQLDAQADGADAVGFRLVRLVTEHV